MVGEGVVPSGGDGALGGMADGVVAPFVAAGRYGRGRGRRGMVVDE